MIILSSLMHTNTTTNTRRRNAVAFDQRIGIYSKRLFKKEPGLELHPCLILSDISPAIIIEHDTSTNNSKSLIPPPVMNV